MRFLPLLDVTVDFYADILNKAFVSAIVFAGVFVVIGLTVYFIKKNKNKDNQDNAEE